MQRLEVSCAVRRVYIYIYVVRRQRVKYGYKNEWNIYWQVGLYNFVVITPWRWHLCAETCSSLRISYVLYLEEHFLDNVDCNHNHGIIDIKYDKSSQWKMYLFYFLLFRRFCVRICLGLHHLLHVLCSSLLTF